MAAEPVPPPRPQDTVPSRPRFVPRPEPAPRPPAGPAPRFIPRPSAGEAPRFIPRPPQSLPWLPPALPAAGPASLPAAPAQSPQAPPAPVQPAPVRYRVLVPAIIGNELRIPVLWCEFGSCIARYTHPDALGERDLRYRALAAGWRYDLLGRLACPSCLQRDATFWVALPPVPVRRC